MCYSFDPQYVRDRLATKLSDAPGKTMCADPAYAQYLRGAVDSRLSREASHVSDPA